MRKNHDADLPADKNFHPVSHTAIVTLPNPLGGPDLLARVNVQPVSLDEQRAIDHNRSRYVELTRLRAGQPNSYLQTQYR